MDITRKPSSGRSTDDGILHVVLLTLTPLPLLLKPKLRVDFVNTELHGPQAGNCAEQFLVVGGDIWPTGFDKICGVNPDQHFYVHLDREKQAEAEQGGDAGEFVNSAL